MKTGQMSFGNQMVEFELPENTDIYSMTPPVSIKNAGAAIQEALQNSLGSPSLDRVIAEKLEIIPKAKTVIVVSDNTRPVPYKGEKGILWPVIEKLLANGIAKENIVILIATGTHRPMTAIEIGDMLDTRIIQAGICIKNHDCHDRANLVHLGQTRRGSEVYINRDYMEADLKILTGLVESHFMAGASGGRKAVCPGIIGEDSTFVFHGAPMLASPQARDLNLEGNPCHEESLEVARKAGVDYIINVTLDHHFNLTGVFAGDLEIAHQQAVKRLSEYVSIPLAKAYDLVLTHAGFVGINHYQAAKAAVVSVPALKPGGRLMIVANNTDPNPVGSPAYQTVLYLLKSFGVAKFNKLLFSPDWSFIPEQWQVQMWTKLFAKIPQENFIYYSPQFTARDYAFIPGVDGNLFLDPETRYQGSLNTIPEVIQKAINVMTEEFKSEKNSEPSIAFLSDGPYGIVV